MRRIPERIRRQTEEHQTNSGEPVPRHRQVSRSRLHRHCIREGRGHRRRSGQHRRGGPRSLPEIGEYGNTLIEDGYRILTHCNAGALAFLDYGTALSPIRHAHASGKKVFVWVDETRPRCQGARLTAWEMEQEGIPYALIVDNAAGHFMLRGEVDILSTGVDRITANGDVANKIGTYEKAVVARENGIPFYVAAPRMTFDLKSRSGDEIEIEERGPEEITGMWGVDEDGEACRVEIAGEGFKVRNPAFDVTPARYVTGFITE
ncbi:hypothetical protein DRO27_05530, partial [Candidatus Bathyarchaeota archaeon]